MMRRFALAHPRQGLTGIRWVPLAIVGAVLAAPVAAAAAPSDAFGGQAQDIPLISLQRLADGRLVAFGVERGANNPQEIVARYTASGALDPSFGSPASPGVISPRGDVLGHRLGGGKGAGSRDRRTAEPDPRPRPGGFVSGAWLRLGPGHYALVCNQPGHYAAGMRADFRVS
jgi:hypothetical protein